MELTRRSTLTLALAALAAPALIRPAHADCGPLNLDKGIVFTRKDGSRGLARREATGRSSSTMSPTAATGWTAAG